jgi:hypothetical protein
MSASMNGRALVAFGVLAVLWTLLLLVGPRYPDPIIRPMTYRNVDLPGPFGVSLSVDSPAFLQLALEPWRLLQPGEVRQSRPGMVLAAAPIAWGLGLVVPPQVASFLAYTLLNLAILVGSFALYLSIVRADGASLPVFLGGLLLLFNDVATYFILAPHTALFNILAPLLCLWIAERVWRDGLFHQRRVFSVALLAGLGFVSYGSLVVALPALLLPAAVREWRTRRTLGLAFLGRALAVGAVLLAPVVAWYALVVSVSGRFYSAEVEMFGMFTWASDGLRTQGAAWVAARLAALARLGLRNAFWMALPALVLVAATFLVHPRPRRALWRQVSTDVALATFVGVLFLAFFVLSGFVWNRNVYSAAVPFVALAGACLAYTARALPPARLRAATGALALAAVAYGAFVLLKDVGRLISLA